MTALQISAAEIGPSIGLAAFAARRSQLRARVMGALSSEPRRCAEIVPLVVSATPPKPIDTAPWREPIRENHSAHVMAYWRSLDVTRQYLHPKLIIAATARVYDVTPTDITGKERTARMVRPRQVSIYLMRTLKPGLSLPDIGRRHGGRNHATIIHAVRKIKAMINEPDLARTVALIMADIEANQ